MMQKALTKDMLSAIARKRLVTRRLDSARLVMAWVFLLVVRLIQEESERQISTRLPPPPPTFPRFEK